MKLTIIIPTRDRNNSVVECVLALDHNEADVVVVDDGSVQQVVLPSDCARVIRHPRHRGRAAAINTGLKAARHDMVLIINDDIYAAPDMVLRLIDEFAIHNNPKLGVAARVMWDPDIPPTLTMKLMEEAKKFVAPILLWKPFVLSQGGYDENFTRRLEDLELELRLKQQGFELRTVETAVAFQQNPMRIRDLIEREFMEGASAVFLHSKFPYYMPQIDDMDALIRNENQAADADSAVEEISLLEQSGSDTLPDGASELFTHICRHYFLHGVFESLKDIGGIKQQRSDSTTATIFKEASRLEGIGEFDEARRLFQLVRQRPDEQYWDRAEYHLGCVESQLGNASVAHAHFKECLRRNPRHNKARRMLTNSTLYREIEPNVFEIARPASSSKVLFVVFGGLKNIVNAFPVVEALRNKFQAETVWLTSPAYAALAGASAADAILEMEPREIIPWDWIHSEGFTHVFFADPEGNQEEWEQSELHPIDFMAHKCGVQVETRRACFEPNGGALIQAEEFLRQNGLLKGAFVTASHGNGKGRHWPNSNLTRLATQLKMPMVVFGTKMNPEIPGTTTCTDKPFQVIAAIIRWSRFYLGPDSGLSWLATTVGTPMAVFIDPEAKNPIDTGLGSIVRGGKHDIREWDIYTSLQTVLTHIESRLPADIAVPR
ncbi:MAG: hypothetical protein DMG15_25800 [Acidobacteria bacterium]|nr:MAG: hypothetical protein DMG16_10245 [Acidobacteriota bacterium]PYS08846.1 MAG: hypothetical protein DMG15_25800 [Acidobacteriota bacterium]